MQGRVRQIDGYYPITVADAVKMGDGTSTTLPEYIQSQRTAVNTAISALDDRIDALGNGGGGTPAAFQFGPMTAAITANAGASITYEYTPISGDFGTLQYVGGICANKKIYCAPNTSDSILVYDTEGGYWYKIGQGFGTQAFKYTGFAAWKGKLYAIPRGVNTMLEVDPVTDEVRVIDLGTSYPVAPYGDYRDSHHYNGVISDTGYMYLPPAYSSDKLLKINMADFSWEELPFLSSDVSTWIGCVKHPTEDKIIFMASNRSPAAHVLRIWDCATDTYTDVVTSVQRACYDMVYDPRYNAFVGVYPNHIFAWFLNDNTIIDSSYINYMSTGYGISLGVDGNYWHLEGARAYRFSFDGTTFTQLTTVTTNQSVGDATPYLAGQAIDNDGNIYGIPASGCMTKLTVSGAARGLPDYIVSSQYYGKY